MERNKIKSTSKYPTSIIIRGLNPLGIEIANSLIEQGGYVIIIDKLTESDAKYLSEIKNHKLLTILDLTSISNIENELRRLDYIFYLSHETKNYIEEISTQEFLQESNFLDSILDLSVKFESKFLLTTSIKAHQIILDSKDFSFTEPSKKHPKYNEIEIQRYSESLVSEYNEKLALDTRIIRLGELMGKGMNPNSDSAYLDLIIAAINGKSLKINGDGLESDFYIHYLDASQGILKSMFSLNTKGKIFSLAIPEEITILSIAYKILDLEPNTGEIKFVDEKRSLPALRLYKPATNLTVLGWENRIGIDRSIALTIEFLKEKAVDIENTQSENDSNRLYTDSEDKQPDKKTSGNALSRLIAERKHQEKSRIGSIVLANEKLRSKIKGTKPPSIQKKMSRNTFWFFENLKKQFKFLKNVTLKEFVFYMMLILIFGLIYLIVFSPILNLSAQVFSIYINGSTIASDIENLNYNSASTKLQSINSSLIESRQRLKDLNFIFNIFGLNHNYNELQKSLQIQTDYTDGLYNTYSSLIPLYDYLTNNPSRFISRLSNDSLLDVELNNTDFNISELDRNKSALELGIEELKHSSDSVSESLNVYPGFIQDIFRPFIDKTKEYNENLFKLYDSYEFINPLLGKNSSTTILTIIQDNTQYTPGGGEYATYILFTFDNGFLNNIQINSFDSIELPQIKLFDYELSALNLLSPYDFSNTIDFNSSTYIKDLKIRSTIAERSFESFFGNNIDSVMWMNLSSLEEFYQ